MRGEEVKISDLEIGDWVELPCGDGSWGWFCVESSGVARSTSGAFVNLPGEGTVLRMDGDPIGVPSRRDVPDWDEYFLGIADAVAARAKCRRRAVGSVAVDDEHRILSTGYNGFPPGTAKDCLTGGCPRGLTRTGEIPPDSPYTDPKSPGFCSALHAEANCVIFSPSASLRGATLYVTDSPCPDCSRLIAGAGLRRVVWPGGEADPMEFYGAR